MILRNEIGNETEKGCTSVSDLCNTTDLLSRTSTRMDPITLDLLLPLARRRPIRATILLTLPPRPGPILPATTPHVAHPTTTTNTPLPNISHTLTSNTAVPLRLTLVFGMGRRKVRRKPGWEVWRVWVEEEGGDHRNGVMRGAELLLATLDLRQGTVVLEVGAGAVSGES